LVQINLEIIACEDCKEDDLERSQTNPNDLSEKNSKLKKKLIQEKKVAKKMQDAMETMKGELYGLQEQHEQQNNHISNELQNLRLEIKEKMDLINVLENENRELEIRTEKAENDARSFLHEIQQMQDQNSEEQDKFGGDKEAQIVQMHEDMQRLLDFKNELEALIEEQNKDIEEKSEKISQVVEELKLYKGEAENNDLYIRNLEKQVKEYKTKYASVNSKLNRLKQG